MGAIWKDDEFPLVIETLRACPPGTKGDIAAALVAAVLRRPVSKWNLAHALAARGLGTPKSYIGVPLQVDESASADDDIPVVHGEPVSSAAPPAAPKPPSDPLDEHVKRNREQRLRAERTQLADRLLEEQSRERFWNVISRPMAPTPIRQRERLSGIREGAAVILASDWHVEEQVFPDAVAGRNEYNLEIAERRAVRFFDGIEWLLGFNREAFALRDVILWLGGDLMTGFIHEELAETNALSPNETVLWLRRVLVDGINRLLSDSQTERLIIPCSYGNHGRTTDKRRIKTGAKNSFEWMLYNFLALHFEHEKRVEFVIDQSAHQYVQAYDFNLHFHHGDELKYAGGVGGLSIPLLKRIPAWDDFRRAHYHHIGHFHQFRDFHRAIVNGSLIGPSEYSFSIGAAFEPPQQAFYVLDSKHGKCQVTPIWVAEEERAAA